MAKLRSINPLNGEEIGSVKIATKAEVEEAVKQAREGFEEWRMTSLDKRSKIMLKLADLLGRNKTKLSQMISEEMGKPVVESKDEVGGAVGSVRYFAEKAREVLRDEVIKPKLIQAEQAKMRRLQVEDAIDYLNKTKAKKNREVMSVVRYDPVGVVAAIKPWNYPIDTAMLSIAPALMAGNAVVFKPSEEVPLVSQKLAELIWQAGVPREVFQIIQGRGQTGAMLVASEIDMVTFTGSSQVGKEIAEKCAAKMIKYVLELGGSSPAIVLKDADLELAVKGIVWGRFANCGQICCALKRVLVEEAVAEKFTKMLIEEVEKIRVGDPKDKKTDMGPLVSQKQLKKLQNQVTKGVVQGGRILTGGRRIRTEPYIKGWFHEPTVMVYVNPKMEIMQEEVFGPVLPVCTVRDFEQAIEYANKSRYGLTAAIFTGSKIKAKEAEKRLIAGTLYVNDPMSFSADAPWCGLKESGVGVGSSKHGIWEFSHKRHIFVDNSGKKSEDYWFPY